MERGNLEEIENMQIIIVDLIKRWEKERERESTRKLSLPYFCRAIDIVKIPVFIFFFLSFFYFPSFFFKFPILSFVSDLLICFGARLISNRLLLRSKDVSLMNLIASSSPWCLVSKKKTPSSSVLFPIHHLIGANRYFSFGISILWWSFHRQFHRRSTVYFCFIICW